MQCERSFTDIIIDFSKLGRNKLNAAKRIEIRHLDVIFLKAEKVRFDLSTLLMTSYIDVKFWGQMHLVEIN